MHKLERVFNPKSVAVVGSKLVDNHSWLRTVLPFDGPKYHVNIDRNEWDSATELGFPNYPSLLDVPGEVDYVIISVPAPIVPRVLRDCIEKKVGGVHLYTAGFSETGTEEGQRLENQIVDMAREGGLNIVGPNCMGIFNPELGVGVNLGGYHGEPGHLSLISQSGGQASLQARRALYQGIRLSKMVSMGNGVVVDSPDYLEYLRDDEQTQVIGMYLEGVRDGRRFFTALREVCEKKPVLIFKVGETEDSARAVEFHSTSITSAPAIWNAALRQCGALRVDSLGELIDMAQLLLMLPPTTGTGVGLLALSGGHSTEMSNVYSVAGFRVPPFSSEARDRILEHFDLTGSTMPNPVEGRTLADPVNMNNLLDVMNDEDGIDMIVHEISVGRGRDGNLSLFRGHVTDIYCEFKARAKKPYVMVISPSFPPSEAGLVEEVTARFQEVGIPVLTGLRESAKALWQFVQYHRSRGA